MRPFMIVLGLFVTLSLAVVRADVDQEPTPAKKSLQLSNGLKPNESAAAMTLPSGFQVKLCAGEPDVRQPIAMAIDDRGRLWVAEAYAYPQRAPEGKGKDRILIFEDTDGDGAFDKHTIFAEKLNLVSGLEVGFGGVWVGAAPYLYFIPDRNGDDKPDSEPVVLLDGWAYQDTHETLNSFIWGPDGWLYGCHGVFTHSNVGKPKASDNERKRINAGIWRYHPTRHVFEVFAEGTSNPWGVDFNDRGHAFATACVIPHLYYIIDGARYLRQAGSHFNPHIYESIDTIAKHRHWVGNQWNNADRFLSDAAGGGHAHAGAMIYLGGAWPKSYRNQLFMNNIHGARLNEDRLSVEGSGYVGNAAPDFLFANDLSSQIINLQYGPDGQMYMIDWYDQTQCHHPNEEQHDRSNGRIYKVSYGENKPVRVDLGKKTDAELVELQGNVNDWYVRHARRLLQERAAAGKLDAATIESLKKIVVENPAPDRKLRGLWALFVTGGLTKEFAVGLLEHADQDVRSWTIQLLCEVKPPDADIVGKFAQMASTDKSAVVRLYLGSALQRLPLEQRWDIARGLASWDEDNNDHNIPFVLWYGVEPMVMSNPGRALELARESKLSKVSRFIVRRLASEEKGYATLLPALDKANLELRRWMLEETAKALETHAKIPMPPAWSTLYTKLMNGADAGMRQNIEYVGVKFGDHRVFPELRRDLEDKGLDKNIRKPEDKNPRKDKKNTGTDPNPKEDRRKWALKTLLDGHDPDLAPSLLRLLDDPKMRLDALTALASYKDEKTPAEILKRYAHFALPEKQAALATLASRPPYVLALLDAIESNAIPRNDLSAFTVRQIGNFNDATINERMNKVWGTLRTTPKEKKEEMEKYRKLLGADVLKNANLPHGRELYNKTCASCHTLFGVGNKIGPDLTGSNRKDLVYILENVIDPSAVVGKDYQMTNIELKDGRTLPGIVKEENATTVTLQMPTEVKILDKKDIHDRQLSPKSIMPEGQMNELPKPDGLRDLVAYLGTEFQVPLPGEAPWINPGTGRADGAIEGEAMKVVSRTDGESKQRKVGGWHGRWSGGQHLYWTGAKVGSKLVLEMPVTTSGKYEVFAVMTKDNHYGTVQLWLDDSKVGHYIDLFGDQHIATTGPVSLGVHELKEGKHTLTVEMVGTNPKSGNGYLFALDYVALLRRPLETKK